MCHLLFLYHAAGLQNISILRVYIVTKDRSLVEATLFGYKELLFRISYIFLKKKTCFIIANELHPDRDL